MNDVRTVADFEDVAVRYGSADVLSGITFESPEGSVLGILGRNGAGKSSLLRCLVGLQQPKHGRARLFDADPWTHSAPLMRRVGFMPEEPDAPPHLTVPELSELAGSFHSTWDTAGVAARLRRMEIPTATRFGDLSRGQKTTTMLALALGHSPELLILDDPTLGLDPIAKRMVVEELIESLAARRMTVVIATQDLDTIERFADHVVILGRRRMLLNETTESLKNRFRRIRGDKETDFSAFQTARVIDQPWGKDAIVTDFSDIRYESWRPAHEGAETAPVSLEEIFIATAGEEAAA